MPKLEVAPLFDGLCGFLKIRFAHDLLSVKNPTRLVSRDSFRASGERAERWAGVLG